MGRKNLNLEYEAKAEPGNVVPNEWYMIQEDERTYTMESGGIVTVFNGRKLRVSDRDTHYIEDSGGDLHIIRNTWNHIVITEMEDPR